MPSLRRLIDPFDLLPPAERLAREAASAAAERLAHGGLALLERALATPEAAEAAELIVRSAPAQRAVRATVEHLDDPATVELLERALDSPRTAALVERVLDSAGMDRLVAQTLESDLLDASVARVLASEQLWTVVDAIARSPSVTEAIAHQGAGFADQVADEVGRRARRADARLERAARRLLRRRPPPPGDAGRFPLPQPP
jgi:hypothetical protein